MDEKVCDSWKLAFSFSRLKAACFVEHYLSHTRVRLVSFFTFRVEHVVEASGSAPMSRIQDAKMAGIGTLIKFAPMET